VNCDVRPLVVSRSAEGGRGWRRRDPGPVPEARLRSGMRGWVLLCRCGAQSKARGPPFRPRATGEGTAGRGER
jgi:hypothetical protein